LIWSHSNTDGMKSKHRSFLSVSGSPDRGIKWWNYTVRTLLVFPRCSTGPSIPWHQESTSKNTESGLCMTHIYIAAFLPSPIGDERQRAASSALRERRDRVVESQSWSANVLILRGRYEGMRSLCRTIVESLLDEHRQKCRVR